MFVYLWMYNDIMVTLILNFKYGFDEGFNGDSAWLNLTTYISLISICEICEEN